MYMALPPEIAGTVCKAAENPPRRRDGVRGDCDKALGLQMGFDVFGNLGSGEAVLPQNVHGLA